MMLGRILADFKQKSSKFRRGGHDKCLKSPNFFPDRLSTRLFAISRLGREVAPGKRTVTQALRVMGLAGQPGFGRYHETLNRARWDARDVARRLLRHLLAVLWPSGEVIIAIDDTIERRWGGKIKARGIYRDPVRSSHRHFVKTSGLRWLSLAVVLPVPFAGRRWALPFLTVLAPSARWSEAQGRRHKTLTDRARQAILQSKRWLADRCVVVVADSSFAALELIAAVRNASRAPGVSLRRAVQVHPKAQ